MAIRHLAFLSPGNFPDTDPFDGLEHTLQLFAYGEALGFDSAWVRQRHLERGVSSAATFLAAASQRTLRIALGTAVVQMGYENPFRLAEDLATVDVLSRRRLHVGLSAGAPPFGALLGERLFDGDSGSIDFSHARVERLRRNLQGELLGDEETFVESPAGRQRPRLQPYAPGLAQRLWYGGGSLRSAHWAGEQGYHLLIGNINRAEQTDQFFEAQRAQLDLFHARWRAQQPQASVPRVALGRVIVPLDGADASTRARYLAWAATRQARTLAPRASGARCSRATWWAAATRSCSGCARTPSCPWCRSCGWSSPTTSRPRNTGRSWKTRPGSSRRSWAGGRGWTHGALNGRQRTPRRDSLSGHRAAATSRPNSITAMA